jgi:hypothetical protein
VTLVGLLLGHVLTLAFALAGQPWPFLVVALATALLDLGAARNGVLRGLLGNAQFGLINRTVVREMSLVILLFRVPDPHTSSRIAVAAAVLLLPIVRFGLLVLRAPLARRRLRPVEWRNLDLPLPEPWVPPRRARSGLELPVRLSTLSLPFAVLAMAFGTWILFYLAVAVAVAVMLTLTALMVAGLVSVRRLPGDDTYIDTLNAYVRELRPEVVLYFSERAVSMYQLNMWLPVLEETNRQCLVIARERATLRVMKPTTIPVICLPKTTTLMDFRIPTVRVGLYAVNVGKNLHYMREPRVKHVFIGHGESDKIASVNPFTKVHDEIWVAGRASRERWAAAKVGIHDDSIVEVGRPQLGSIEHRRPRHPDAPLTVLYAPTWEGWTSDPFASSLLTMGPGLIRWLLEREQPTRVLYKPHPLTGTVSPRAKAAHREILALLSEAGARNTTSKSILGVDIPDPTASEDALEGRDEAFQAAYVPEGDLGSHLIIRGASPTLYECFNISDVLVSDISSVVADFVASGKPYVVTNPGGLDHDDIWHKYATARAAYLADPDPDTWEPMMELLTGADPLARARVELRTFLLGPTQPPPMTRWNNAIDDLIERADAEWPDAERESALVHLE